MIYSNNKLSGFRDCDGKEIVGGDEITIHQENSNGNKYLVDYLPEYERWFFFKQYGTIDELSLEGDLKHCIENLGYRFRIVDHIIN